MLEVFVTEYRAEDISFELDLSQPLYEQVTEQMRQSIARGGLETGSRIPSIRELAQHLKVNPNTVMRSYQELERDGLIETRIGQGTYVTASEDKVKAVRRSLARLAAEEYAQTMRKLGLDLKDARALLEEADWQ
jgi:GntR family transcriptional regulator